MGVPMKARRSWVGQEGRVVKGGDFDARDEKRAAQLEREGRAVRVKGRGAKGGKSSKGGQPERETKQDGPTETKAAKEGQEGQEGNTSEGE